RRRRESPRRRIHGLRKSARRGRRGLSPRRAHPQLPRLREIAREAERAHGHRLSLGAPVPPGARIAAAGEACGLGRRWAKEYCAVAVNAECRMPNAEKLALTWPSLELHFSAKASWARRIRTPTPRSGTSTISRFGS